MSRQLIHLTSLFLILAIAGSTSADLVGHWTLDEGSGTTAADSSGNGNNLTFGDGTPQWVDGYIDGALAFDGASDVTIAEASDVLRPASLTVTAWVKTGSLPGGWSWVCGQGDAWGLVVNRYNEEEVFFYYYTAPGWPGVSSGNVGMIDDEWHHIAGGYDDAAETIFVYKDGVQVGTEASASPAAYAGNDNDFVIGAVGQRGGGNRYFNGTIDDVRVYDHVLSEAEMLKLFLGEPGMASEPNPADKATDVPRDVVLSWVPGDFAVKHNVYFGISSEDVNDGIAGATLVIDLDVNSIDPALLEFGQTYYWRVDEVNGAPDFTIFQGEVWGFTVEPFAYPLQSVTATASSSSGNDTGPEKTIDGSGLNEQDQHSIAAPDMWLSAAEANPWIQYEFDKAYKLHEMWVWNSNQLVEPFVGFGAKDVTIETSVDGTEWTLIENGGPFAQASGSPDYTANTVVDLGSAFAKFVRLTITGGWGAIPQYGLSEVRFFFVPTFAREPRPEDGALTEDVDIVLGWRAGRDVATHEVVLSSDLAAVENGSAVVGTTQESSFTPASINIDTTYYWQINEVNEAETPARHEGDIWSFSTPAYLVVDDFEGYNNDCDRIFFAWQDGFGHNGGEGIDNCGVAAYNGNGTGSIVGHAESPFAEKTIVHSGNQSMPLEYDSGVSEAVLSLDGQNWAANGIQSLSLWFYGALGNTGQLYLKINNVEVPFDGNAAGLSNPFWTQWNVELGAVGTDLTRVNALTIGIKGASAQGVLYVDDIRLYGQAPDMLTPQDPGTANLVAYYAMENNSQDGSGKGNHGTSVGAPMFAPGIRGMAMDFDGFDDRVDLGPLDVAGSGITLSLWLNPESFVYDDTRVISKATSTSENDHWWMLSTSGGSHVLRFRLKTDDGAGTTTLIAGSGGVLEGEWTHGAATWDGSTMRIFQNLQEVGSTAKGGTAVAIDASINAAIGNQPEGAGDKHWDGLIDEVRIYNRGLSEAELLHVASGP